MPYNLFMLIVIVLCICVLYVIVIQFCDFKVDKFYAIEQYLWENDTQQLYFSNQFDVHKTI